MASFIDIAIVFGYLAVMLVIGFLISRKEDLDGYFVNNRKTKTFMLLTATIATTIGAGAIVGTASLTYRTGIGIGIALTFTLGLSWLFVAIFAKKIKGFGDKTKALTMGDFYACRYSKKAMIIVASIIAMSTFFWMAVQLLAIGNMFSVLTGLDFRIGLMIAALVTIIYVSLGGIKSDFYTDAIQFWIMLLIFIILIPLGLSYIGGVGSLSKLPPSHFDLFAFGGPLVFFGVLLFGIPFQLTAMDTWQRLYSASDEKTAKRSVILASIINPLFYICAIILGLIATVAFSSGLNGDQILFKLMDATLPAGLLGIGMVSLLAIVMSSFDSSIVTLSAIVTKDFYKGIIKPSATGKEMLKMGRFVGLVSGIIALTIALLIPDIIQLFLYAATFSLIFAPALIGGFYWKRATAKAAIFSTIIGFITAIILMPLLKEKVFVPAFIISLIVFVSASYLTKHSKSEDTSVVA